MARKEAVTEDEILNTAFVMTREAGKRHSQPEKWRQGQDVLPNLYSVYTGIWRS